MMRNEGRIPGGGWVPFWIRTAAN